MLIGGQLTQIRFAKIFAERLKVFPANAKGGLVEFECKVGMGGFNEREHKNKATAKVILEAKGNRRSDPSSASVRDFTIEVECRGVYIWPDPVEKNQFESLDIRNLLCQPVYTVALSKVKELLNSLGITGIPLPYDIRTAQEGNNPPTAITKAIAKPKNIRAKPK